MKSETPDSVLTNWIREGEYHYHPALIIGKPGAGKTYLIETIAKKFNKEVQEVEPDGNLIATASLFSDSVIYVIDIIDDYPGKVQKSIIRKYYPIPVVVTAYSKNNVINELIESSTVIYLNVQYQTIIQVATQEGISLTSLNSDLRQLKLSKYGSMGYDNEKTYFESLKAQIKSGKYTDLDFNSQIILLDMADKMFFGWQLYLFVKSLSVASLSRPSAIDGFSFTGEKDMTSYFFAQKRRI